MADKKEQLYASIVLVDGMEYMAKVDKDWETKAFEEEGFVKVSTIDDKPIYFGKDRINLIRQVGEVEFKAFKRNLDAHRAKMEEEAKNGKK